MDGQKKNNQHGWTWIELDGHGQEKMWIHWAAWTWMAVVFDREPPAGLAAARSVETATQLVLEGVPDVDNVHQELLRVPRISRLLVPLATVREAVPNTAAPHFGLLI